MATRKDYPVALTIAGSDSGGGAGIQADLKTFQALDVHGTSVISCLTAQNPEEVLGVQAASPDFVKLQLTAIFQGFKPAAVKTGMLYSAEIIAAVIEFLSENPPPFLTVDPVMVSTSGAQLLQPAAQKLLMERLLPLADLITPNLDEAELLSGVPISNPEDMREAARLLHTRHGCAVLLKGGHLRGSQEAIDILWDGHQEWILSASFIKGVSTHGTGCTYSAAITAQIAKGKNLIQAVTDAKEFVTSAIAGSRKAGRSWVMVN